MEVFTRAAPGAPARPRKIIRHTLKYFGRMCDQNGPTLEPWEVLTCVVILERWDLALSVLQLRLQADVDVVDQMGEQGQREGYGRTVLL